MASENIYEAGNFSLIPFLEVVTPILTFATPIALEWAGAKSTMQHIDRTRYAGGCSARSRGRRESVGSARP